VQATESDPDDDGVGLGGGATSLPQLQSRSAARRVAARPTAPVHDRMKVQTPRMTTLQTAQPELGYKARMNVTLRRGRMCRIAGARPVARFGLCQYTPGSKPGGLK
jgi:hypothetical protein